MKKQEPTLYHKSLVAYLYFIQGIFLCIPRTIILTYKEMPSYGILGYFSLALIPFSFKFISAPFTEKFTFIAYGRRKTWVAVSLIFASLFVFFCTYFTEQSQHSQITLAYFLIGVIFMISLQDISTDALAVKELNNPQLASYLQCVMQSIGGIVGRTVFFQLVSGTLYKKLGFQLPFLTVSQFFSGLSGLTLASVFIIHVTYKQKLIKQQSSKKYSLWQVILHYKYFVMPKYMLFRQGLIFVLYMHGLNYFFSSFLIELIKNQHISKDWLTSLSSIMIIPVLILVSILKKYWREQGNNSKRTRYLLSSRLVFSVIFFIFQVQSPSIISIFFCIFTLLEYAQFYNNSIVVNSIADPQFSGMFVTMMASLTNLGNNTAIQLEIIDVVGYRPAAISGFIYTAIIICIFGFLDKWVQNGIKKQNEDVKKIQYKKI